MVIVPAKFDKPLNCFTFLLQLNAIDTNQSIDKTGKATGALQTSVAPICSLYEMDVYLKRNFVITQLALRNALFYFVSGFFCFFFWFRRKFHGIKCIFCCKKWQNNMYFGYVLIFLLISSLIFPLSFMIDIVRLKRIRYNIILMTYLTSFKCHIPTML